MYFSRKWDIHVHNRGKMGPQNLSGMIHCLSYQNSLLTPFSLILFWLIFIPYVFLTDQYFNIQIRSELMDTQWISEFTLLKLRNWFLALLLNNFHVQYVCPKIIFGLYRLLTFCIYFSLFVGKIHWDPLKSHTKAQTKSVSATLLKVTLLSELDSRTLYLSASVIFFPTID